MLTRVALFGVLFLLAVALIANFAVPEIQFATYHNGKLVVSDYGYHSIIVAAFWFEGIDQIYRLESLQQALSSYLGANVQTVMPLGVTPFAFLLWLPFAALARWSEPASYAAWISFSLLLFASGVWRIHGLVIARRDSFPQLAFAMFLVLALSGAMFTSVMLGQTSILTVGALLLLLAELMQRQETTSGSVIPVLCYVVLCSMKPPYLAFAFAFLMLFREWRVLKWSVVCLIGLILICNYKLGLYWPVDYYAMLSVYDGREIPWQYSWSIVWPTMVIFRSAFADFLGHPTAALISKLAIVACFALALLPAVRRPRAFDEDKTLCSIIMLVGGYLLFSPYAGVYEDLLFAVLFSVYALKGVSLRISNMQALLSTIAIVVVLSHKYFPLDKPLWVFWLLKLFVVVFVFWMLRQVWGEENA